tara:strand:- start:575 stop:793 length:219 start_codon:yes stop_codon:yes gene_type:complete
MSSLDAKMEFSLIGLSIVIYGYETWWMKSTFIANNYEGQFKVTRGHLRSNGLPLMYGHDNWWVESSLDAKHY